MGREVRWCRGVVRMGLKRERDWEMGDAAAGWNGVAGAYGGEDR